MKKSKSVKKSSNSEFKGNTGFNKVESYGNSKKKK